MNYHEITITNAEMSQNATPSLVLFNNGVPYLALPGSDFDLVKNLINFYEEEYRIHGRALPKDTEAIEGQVYPVVILTEMPNKHLSKQERQNLEEDLLIDFKNGVATKLKFRIDGKEVSAVRMKPGLTLYIADVRTWTQINYAILYSKFE